MSQVNAICTNCNSEILIEEKNDAEICPNCGSAFVCEKAIKLYNKQSKQEKQIHSNKIKHFFKWFALGFLFTLKCIVYLLFVLSCVWLFFDIVDKKK